MEKQVIQLIRFSFLSATTNLKRCHGRQRGKGKKRISRGKTARVRFIAKKKC